MRTADIRPAQIVKYKFGGGKSEEEWKVKGLIIIDTGFLRKRKVRQMVEVYGNQRRFFASQLTLVKDVER